MFKTNALSADVDIANTTSYFDGPTVSVDPGEWIATGHVTVAVTTDSFIRAKLWDGTNVIASSLRYVHGNETTSIHLSGGIQSGGGSLKISVQNPSNTTGKIVFNRSGGGKDSVITAF